jgi:hypothetical protein
MNAILLIYITGALCFASVYPALYNYSCMEHKKELKHKQFVGVLVTVFWPLFLLYVYICAITNFKFTKKGD